MRISQKPNCFNELKFSEAAGLVTRFCKHLGVDSVVQEIYTSKFMRVLILIPDMNSTKSLKLLNATFYFRFYLFFFGCT